MAFFQVFLDRIRSELSPDVVVIDSRTGFSEIGGLCTQQLADETVILSSLARESVKMTRHLAKIISASEISKQLDKRVETKIVVSRVPRPQEIDKLKAQCCEWFEVDETKLFFLFSSSNLEQEEFIAMLDPQKDEGLFANYMQLFQGLDVEVAQESIREQIERAERGLLSCSKEEAEARIRELVALYPHPEVYRRAMRFFDLRDRPDEASSFGLRLLALAPTDQEASLAVARLVLRGDFSVHGGFFPGRSRERSNWPLDAKRLLSIAKRAYDTGVLSAQESVRLADLLEDVGDNETSYEIALASLASAEGDSAELRNKASGIAARTRSDLEERMRRPSLSPEFRCLGSVLDSVTW